MLKTSLLIIFIMCVATLSAQQVRFGIFGGFAQYDAPSYEAVTTEKIKSAAVTNAGAFVDYNVINNYGVVFRLGYDIKKIALEEQTDLVYIDLGLLLKMDLDNTYAKGFYIFGGPRIAMLTSAKIKDVEIEEGINNTQIGVIAGVGVHLNKFLEIDLFLDADTASVLSQPNQQVKVIGFGFNIKLEMNAMLNWHVPSVDPLQRN
jgi:hypothetical protein